MACIFIELTDVLFSGKKRRTFENGSSEGRRQVEITGPLESRRNVEITGPIIEGLTSVSSGETESPLPNTIRHSKSSSPRTRTGTGQSDDGGLWKTSPLYVSSSDGEDDEVPDLLKRFSQNGFPETGKQSDTLSSDIIVNSISTGEGGSWEVREGAGR